MRVQNVLGVLLGLLVLTACPPPPPPPPGDLCKDVSCGDHGICNAETGTCDCDAAYSGDSCDTFDCSTLSCGDHGSCNANTASCQCSGNWEGELCDSAIPLEIVGDYVDNWGFEHSVTQSTWTTMGSIFNISQADNSQNFLIAQNDGANAYNPDLWSRFDWIYDGDNNLFYCQTAFDAASEDAALATTPADANDLAAGCGGYAWSQLNVALIIRGDYVDDWGFDHSINESAWVTMGSVFNISQFDNTQRFVIAQNDSANAYNPDLWSRFDWFVDGDAQLYYCQTAFDAADEAAALATSPADSADLAAGCGGYSWSQLDIALNIRGGYVDDWDFNHFVTQDTWTMPGATDSVFHIRQFDNDARYIIAENDSANPYNPDKWSRFDWTHNGDGNLFYCQTAFDAASEDAALATTPADANDLATGCGGYAWSPLESLSLAGDYSAASSTAVHFGAFAVTISSDSFAIEVFSNSNHHVVAKNGSSNASNADLYSRFDWFVDGGGDLYLCHTLADGADRAAALAATAANSGDLATGCNGSAWMALAPVGG